MACCAGCTPRPEGERCQKHQDPAHGGLCSCLAATRNAVCPSRRGHGSLILLPGAHPRARLQVKRRIWSVVGRYPTQRSADCAKWASEVFKKHSELLRLSQRQAWARKSSTSTSSALIALIPPNASCCVTDGPFSYNQRPSIPSWC